MVMRTVDGVDFHDININMAIRNFYQECHLTIPRVAFGAASQHRLVGILVPHAMMHELIGIPSSSTGFCRHFVMKSREGPGGTYPSTYQQNLLRRIGCHRT